MEWLTLARVTKAANLFETSDCAVWEVAQAVGFRSLRTFERAFKRITLLSPREFRALSRPS